MSGERRRNQRRKVLLEARWESLSKHHEARVDDVSMSGCFVNTYGPVETGEAVELRILLPSGEWLPVRGHVATYQFGVGFGLAFSGLTEESENALRELIARARDSEGDG
ncbi:MAG TPA: PilZ domain-containing protein [Pyrinomonadaceae bacterium]|nr:PilZ domain-containing protein [Pyrinomonadaceae bacterium]